MQPDLWYPTWNEFVRGLIQWTAQFAIVAPILLYAWHRIKRHLPK